MFIFLSLKLNKCFGCFFEYPQHIFWLRSRQFSQRGSNSTLTMFFFLMRGERGPNYHENTGHYWPTSRTPYQWHFKTSCPSPEPQSSEGCNTVYTSAWQMLIHGKECYTVIVIYLLKSSVTESEPILTCR